jgi:hypothetical protein
MSTQTAIIVGLVIYGCMMLAVSDGAKPLGPGLRAVLAVTRSATRT